jgi:hypothetical protein
MGAAAFLRRILATDILLARLARARPRSMGVNILTGLAFGIGMLVLRAAASAFYKDITAS